MPYEKSFWDLSNISPFATGDAACKSANGRQTSPFFYERLKTSKHLLQVWYNDVASVLRQSDRTISSGSNLGSNTYYKLIIAKSNQAVLNASEYRNNSRQWQNLSTFQLVKLKLSKPCHVCGNIGHWADAHHRHGSLKLGTSSFQPKSNQSMLLLRQSKVANQSLPNTVGFTANMAKILLKTNKKRLCISFRQEFTPLMNH